jgi:hypothetical protein
VAVSHHGGGDRQAGSVKSKGSPISVVHFEILPRLTLKSGTRILLAMILRPELRFGYDSNHVRAKDGHE